MNYTKTLRQYCLQHNGSILDVACLADRYFPMVPYKSLLKILNRLRDEGIITSVSKGVYLIGDGDLDDAIWKYYLGSSHGMFIGDQLFYEEGILSEAPEVAEIITNAIVTDHKTIGKYHLTKVDLFFSVYERELICILNILEKGYTLSMDAQVKCAQYLADHLFPVYSDRVWREIVQAMHIPYSTVVKMHETLTANRIKNDCIGIYNELNA